jgi:CheY-like chemotaxis protein
MAHETILVVEDEALVAEEIREDLEALGYKVPAVVSSGEEVMQAVAAHKPALVLMDIRLDGSVDGIEAAFLAKAEFGVPVVFLTAYSDSDTLERVAASDPSGYILKPFDERQLAATVEMALKKALVRSDKKGELAFNNPLIDALDTAAILVDLDGKIAHANECALATLKAPNLVRIKGESLSRFIEAGADRQASILALDGLPVASHARSRPLYQPDGTQIGNLVLLERMNGKERALLESSASDMNKAMLGLLPEKDAAGAGFEVRGFLVPSPSGSGDLYDAFRVGKDHAAFFALNVMGHGALASFIACSIRDHIRGCAVVEGGTDPRNPAEALRCLNTRFRSWSVGATNYFYTLVYGLLDTRNGRYRVARAGHPPPILLPAVGPAEALKTEGGAIGISDELKIEEAAGSLGRGGRLLVFSKGLLEAVGGSEIARSILALGAAADRYRDKSLDDFVEAFREAAARHRGSGFADDMSFLVIERR